MIGLSGNKKVAAFLKKAAQKTFSQQGLWRCHQHGPVQQSFFASFYSQKEAFLFA
jgi:hypothetical protein